MKKKMLEKVLKKKYLICILVDQRSMSSHISNFISSFFVNYTTVFFLKHINTGLDARK